MEKNLFDELPTVEERYGPAKAGTLTELYHPPTYQNGVRILMLRGRPKDGTFNRIVQRVSYDAEDFQKQYESLKAGLKTNERIYAAAGARDTRKAMMEFRRRQLESEFAGAPVGFYKHLESTWISCLMIPISQGEKLWMFDCDTGADEALVEADLAEHYDRPQQPYWYRTKNGAHCIVQPFDKSRIAEAARRLIHDNPLMLWAY